MQDKIPPQLDRRRSISDQLYEYLRQMIVSLEFRPGEAVSEPDISQRFGVSRTPVREALLRLAHEGLVMVIPQFGTFVAAIDVDAVRQVQFLRENLEVAVGLRLCRMERRVELQQFRDLLVQQKQTAKAHGYIAFLPVDDKFHQTLFEVAEMDQVWTVIQAKKAHLDRVRALHTPEPGKLDEVIAQHTAILDFIEARDEAGVEKTIRAHTSGVLTYLEHLKDTQSELFEPMRPVRPRKGAAAKAEAAAMRSAD